MVALEEAVESGFDAAGHDMAEAMHMQGLRRELTSRILDWPPVVGYIDRAADEGDLANRLTRVRDWIHHNVGKTYFLQVRGERRPSCLILT